MFTVIASNNHFIDATNVDLTNATWAGSEASGSVVFGTTTLRLYAGELASRNNTTPAHLWSR